MAVIVSFCFLCVIYDLTHLQCKLLFNELILNKLFLYIFQKYCLLCKNAKTSFAHGKLSQNILFAFSDLCKLVINNNFSLLFFH